MVYNDLKMIKEDQKTHEKMRNRNAVLVQPPFRQDRWKERLWRKRFPHMDDDKMPNLAKNGLNQSITGPTRNRGD